MEESVCDALNTDTSQESIVDLKICNPLEMSSLSNLAVSSEFSLIEQLTTEMSRTVEQSLRPSTPAEEVSDLNNLQLDVTNLDAATQQTPQPAAVVPVESTLTPMETVEEIDDGTLTVQSPQQALSECIENAFPAESTRFIVNEEDSKGKTEELEVPMECTSLQVVRNDKVTAESSDCTIIEPALRDVSVSDRDSDMKTLMVDHRVEVAGPPLKENPTQSDSSSGKTVCSNPIAKAALAEVNSSSDRVQDAASIVKVPSKEGTRAHTSALSEVVPTARPSSSVKVASLVKVASSVNTVTSVKAESPVRSNTSVKQSSAVKSTSLTRTSSVMKVASSVKVVSSAKSSTSKVFLQQENMDCGEPLVTARSPFRPVEKVVVHKPQETIPTVSIWGEEEAVSSEEGAEAMSEGGDSIETEPEVVTERDAGFKVNWLALRDARTGRLLWATDVDLASGDSDLRVVAKIPKEVLHMDAINRELNFSTAESLDNLRLEQRVLFKGRCLEEWHFHLGSVEPTSSQTWTSVFHSTPECQLMPIEALNGHLVLYTCFLDGVDLLAVSTIEILYV